MPHDVGATSKSTGQSASFNDGPQLPICELRLDERHSRIAAIARRSLQLLGHRSATGCVVVAVSPHSQYTAPLRASTVIAVGSTLSRRQQSRANSVRTYTSSRGETLSKSWKAKLDALVKRCPRVDEPHELRTGVGAHQRSR